MFKVLWVLFALFIACLFAGLYIIFHFLGSGYPVIVRLLWVFAILLFLVGLFYNRKQKLLLKLSFLGTLAVYGFLYLETLPIHHLSLGEVEKIEITDSFGHTYAYTDPMFVNKLQEYANNGRYQSFYPFDKSRIHWVGKLTVHSKGHSTVYSVYEKSGNRFMLGREEWTPSLFVSEKPELLKTALHALLPPFPKSK